MQLHTAHLNSRGIA